MSELSDLYQELIIDHSKRPRNFGQLDSKTHHADGHNPLCGDKLTVFLLIQEDRIVDLKFVGSGCAISTASASLMTDAVKGKSLKAVEHLFQAFHDVLTGKEPDANVPLGKLGALSGVAEFPVRVKCATLSWHTLKAAIQSEAKPTTTE